MSASPESHVISRGGLYEPRTTTRRRCRTRNDDEKARAEVMQSADEAARCRAADEADAVVRVVGRRRVVERQEGAGEELNRDERQEHAAEREDPSRAGGNLLVEQHMPRGAETGPRVEPLQQPGHATAARHTRTSTVSSVPSTLASIVVSGRGGGPSRTLPLASYMPPWQGQLNFFASPSQST